MRPLGFLSLYFWSAGFTGEHCLPRPPPPSRRSNESESTYSLITSCHKKLPAPTARWRSECLSAPAFRSREPASRPTGPWPAARGGWAVPAETLQERATACIALRIIYRESLQPSRGTGSNAIIPAFQMRKPTRSRLPQISQLGSEGSGSRPLGCTPRRGRPCARPLPSLLRSRVPGMVAVRHVGWPRSDREDGVQAPSWSRRESLWHAALEAQSTSERKRNLSFQNRPSEHCFPQWKPSTKTSRDGLLLPLVPAKPRHPARGTHTHALAVRTCPPSSPLMIL